MKDLFFNIYGYKMQISSARFKLNSLKVNLDFGFFSEKTALSAINLQIELLALSNKERSGLKILNLRHCQLRYTGLNARQIVYSDGSHDLAIVEDRFVGKIRTVKIYAQNVEIIDDVLYFLVNSAAGEYLDSQGLMRLHGFSFQKNDTTICILGSSGAGKSTLALEFLTSCSDRPSQRIYSDEVSILNLKDRNLLPYPIQISTSDLHLARAPAEKFNYFFKKKFVIPIVNLHVAKPAPLLKVLYLSESVSSILRIYFDILFGIGLIQMVEYLLRPLNFISLLKIFINRIKLIILIQKFFDIQRVNRSEAAKIVNTI